MHLDLPKEFSLEGFRRAERSLLGLGWPASHKERITRELIREKQRVVLGDFVLSDDGHFYTTDDQQIFARCPLPYTGGVAWFEGTEGLAHQLNWLVGLARLQRIKQLSLLGPPVCQGELQTTLSFDHNRFVHTYDVYAIGMVIGHNVGVAGKDFLALRLSLLVHDLFTPACGDLMKFVDRNAYDEDALLDGLLTDPSWKSVCEGLGVDPREPIRIAQEKDGILCSVRDLADTLAYVARDLWKFHGDYRGSWRDWYEDEESKRLEDELRKVSADPKALMLWQNVQKGAGSIVVDDHTALERFLFARACLFRLLYYHRQTRHIEYILGIRIVKILLSEGILSPADFFGSNGIDDLIWDKVDRVTGYLCYGLHHGDRGETRLFPTLEAAKEWVARSCAESPDACGLIYTWPSATKSKVASWSVVKGGREMPWSEAYPAKAKRIEEVMTLPKGYYAAVARRGRLPHIKEKYWQALRKLSQDVV